MKIPTKLYLKFKTLTSRTPTSKQTQLNIPITNKTKLLYIKSILESSE